jgi:hypothetical protein
MLTSCWYTGKIFATNVGFWLCFIGDSIHCSWYQSEQILRMRLISMFCLISLWNSYDMYPVVRNIIYPYVLVQLQSIISLDVQTITDPWVTKSQESKPVVRNIIYPYVLVRSSTYITEILPSERLLTWAAPEQKDLWKISLSCDNNLYLLMTRVSMLWSGLLMVYVQHTLRLLARW